MPTAPLILAIETATRAGSISLARGETILSTITGDPGASHSTDLIQNIDLVLRRGGVTLKDVEVFAAATGPGSFTGLRIGLATVKSFAVSGEKPCVGVSTLAAIAHAAGYKSARVISLLPAGRGEAFAQMFSTSGTEIESLDAAAHIPPSQLLEKYGGFDQIIWAGDGARLHAEMLRGWAEARGIEFRSAEVVSHNDGNRDGRALVFTGWLLAPECRKLSISVALLGLREFRCGNVLSPQQLLASYVRPADAEIPKSWQHQDQHPRN
jgi:tRNA threonylcarbamoyladenosine biosynthesis protein TsaB